jgi:gliding motility-associated lipoprotein GldD
MKILTIFFLLSGILLVSCESNEKPIPKPPTFLKIDLPNRSYTTYTDTCNFAFEKPGYFKVKSIDPSSCNRDILFESLNGVIHLSVIDMDTSLAAYVNYAIDKVDEHKVKATAIKDSSFIDVENKVYGTLFELQGNVATPFQFYLTDSVSRFLSGVIYFNSRPNYDSIRPVLNYVKEDLFKMMETTEWKEE